MPFKQMKRTFSECNLDSAQKLIDYVDYQKEAVKDEEPNFNREVVKSTIVMPIFFSKKAYALCVDRDILIDLEEAVVINWCHAIRNVVPLNIRRDNNSLCHAVSVYIFGVHDKNHTIRQLLYARLFTEEQDDGDIRKRWLIQLNASTNQSFDKSVIDRRWKQIVFSVSEKAERTVIESIHIFALANLIGRPIIIVSTNIVLRGIYLPVLKKPTKCEKSPVILAFVSGHFVPLLSSENHTVPFCKQEPSELAQHCVPLKDLNMHFSSEGENPGLLIRYMEIVMIPHKDVEIKAAMLKFRAPPAYSVELLWHLEKFAKALTDNDFGIDEMTPESDISDDMLYQELPTGDNRNILNNSDNELIQLCSRNIVGCKNAASANAKGLCDTCYEEFMKKSNTIRPRRKPLEKKEEKVNHQVSNVIGTNTQNLNCGLYRNGDIRDINRHFPIEHSRINASVMRKCMSDHCSNIGHSNFVDMCENCYNKYTSSPIPPSMKEEFKTGKLENKAFYNAESSEPFKNESGNSETYSRLQFSPRQKHKDIAKRNENGMQNYSHLNKSFNSHSSHVDNNHSEDFMKNQTSNDRSFDDNYWKNTGFKQDIKKSVSPSISSNSQMDPSVNGLHSKMGKYPDAKSSGRNSSSSINNSNPSNSNVFSSGAGAVGSTRQANSNSSFSSSYSSNNALTSASGAAGSTRHGNMDSIRSKILCAVPGCTDSIDIDDERYCLEHSQTKKPQKCFNCDNTACDIIDGISLCTTCYESQLKKTCEEVECDKFVAEDERFCNLHYNREVLPKCLICDNKSGSNGFLLCNKCFAEHQNKINSNPVEENIGRGTTINENIGRGVIKCENVSNNTTKKESKSGDSTPFEPPRVLNPRNDIVHSHNSIESSSLPHPRKTGGMPRGTSRGGNYKYSHNALPAPPRFDSNISPLEDEQIGGSDEINFPKRIQPSASASTRSGPPSMEYQSKSGETKQDEAKHSPEIAMPGVYDGFIANVGKNPVLDWQKSSQQRSNSFPMATSKVCTNSGCRQPGRPDLQDNSRNCDRMQKAREFQMGKPNMQDRHQVPASNHIKQHVPQSRMQRCNSDNNPTVVRLPQVPQNGSRNSSNRNLGDSYEFLFHEDAEDQSAANSSNRNVPRNNSNPRRNQHANVQRKHCLKAGCEFFGDESYGGYCSGCFLAMTKEENPGQSQQLDDNAERNEGAYNVQGFLGAHSHEIRRKCRNGECDMYGSFEFEFFCSKCFKERPMLVERDMLSVW